jgi:hypothetical protein
LTTSKSTPSRQIELALRHPIHDPFIRRVIWEGIESKRINNIDTWLSCPAPAPETLQSESIFSVVSRAFSNGPPTLPKTLVNVPATVASCTNDESSTKQGGLPRFRAIVE